MDYKLCREQHGQYKMANRNTVNHPQTKPEERKKTAKTQTVV